MRKLYTKITAKNPKNFKLLQKVIYTISSFLVIKVGKLINKVKSKINGMLPNIKLVLQSLR